MVRQTGPIKIVGTIDNINFYQREGEFYLRMKSSLDAKRVKSDPAFKKTMENASLLGKASKIASLVYSSIPQEQRYNELYKKMVGQAMRLIKSGASKKKAIEMMNASEY